MINQNNKEDQSNLFRCTFYPIVNQGKMKEKCLYEPALAYKYILGRLSNRQTTYYNRHVPHCGYCRGYLEIVREVPKKLLVDRIARIAQEQVNEHRYQRDLKATGCLDTDDQIDYLFDKLSRKKAIYLEDHLTKCDECKAEMNILKKLKSDGALD